MDASPVFLGLPVVTHAAIDGFDDLVMKILTVQVSVAQSALETAVERFLEGRLVDKDRDLGSVALPGQIGIRVTLETEIIFLGLRLGCPESSEQRYQEDERQKG